MTDPSLRSRVLARYPGVECLPWTDWLLLAALAVLLALTALSATASATPRGDGRHRKPAIVLVHGAWAGPSSWDRVVDRLRDDGYRTATPTLDMLSLAGDVATVRATLDRIPDPKLLVGHSYVDIPEWSVRLLFLPRHRLSLLRMQASDYGAGRFPPAGLIPWRGDRR